MNSSHVAPPAGMLAFGLVFALGALGIVYGLWAKVLVIQTTVETGRVHAVWRSAVSTDPPGANDLRDTEGNRYDKDVGELECRIDGSDPQILHFIVHNGYPSYFADCEVAWVNDGTIPVKVVDLRVGPEAGPLVSIPFDIFVDLDLNSDGKFDINFMVENGLCTQVHPGERDAYSIWVHVKQDAPPGQTLKLKAEVQLNQWNESSPPCPP